VGEAFYSHGAASVIVNLAKFNSLPEHLQKLILQSMEKAEPLIKEKEKELEAKNFKILENNGMKHIQWSPGDSRTFLDKVNQISFEVDGKKIEPAKLDKMKKMMGY
jgi:TRAP-type C4-dicarboxylate transport system substrate-binding protein